MQQVTSNWQNFAILLSFGEPTDKPTVLWAWLVRNLERLIEELHYHQVAAGRVSVWVGYRDGRAGQGAARPLRPEWRFDLLLDVLRPCLRTAWIPHAAANRMHLIADDLRPRTETQLTLFECDGAAAGNLATLKKAINDKAGRFTVRSGATLPLNHVYGDPANGYDICDVREKVCF